MTLKQITTAKPPQDDEHLIINGQPMTQIKVMVQIKEIIKKKSWVEYTINDYTATLRAKQWRDEKENSSKQYFAKDTWVEIIGKIVHFDGICTISIHSIRIVDDFNLITQHGLQVLCQYLEHTKIGNAKIKALESANSIE